MGTITAQGRSHVLRLAGGVVVLVLFGAKKVPELMKGVGTGIKEFKKASRDVQDELERAVNEPASTPPPAPKPAQETVSHSSTPSSTPHA